MHAHASLTEVFVAALITAIFTGFGAIPFFFVKQMSRRWLGLANAIAAGLMLAASFSLIYQGFAESWLRTSLGVLAGLVFIALSRGLLSHAGDHEHPHAHGPAALALGTVSRAEATKMILIVGVMTLAFVQLFRGAISSDTCTNPSITPIPPSSATEMLRKANSVHRFG